MFFYCLYLFTVKVKDKVKVKMSKLPIKFEILKLNK